LDRLFLDANVLFSAAYRDDAGLRRLWVLEAAQLLTSRFAAEEARRNVRAKRPHRVADLEDLLGRVEIEEPGGGDPLPPEIELPERDRPILLAAIRARATHLITGDTRHFGRYAGKTIAGVHILPPSAYLATRRTPGSE
jgi:predicted nucleic acid-binding protein